MFYCVNEYVPQKEFPNLLPNIRNSKTCHFTSVADIMDELGSSAQFAYQLCWIYAFLFYIYVKRCNKFSYYIPVRINVKVTILYKSCADA